jgi:DNA-binding NarL/FixJ family response regulator
MDEIHLNEKERIFIELKSKGMTNKEIAPFLYRSTSSVKNFIKTLLTKTGCRNTHDLIAWAFENKIQKINDQKSPSEIKKTG